MKVIQKSPVDEHWERRPILKQKYRKWLRKLITDDIESFVLCTAFIIGGVLILAVYILTEVIE